MSINGHDEIYYGHSSVEDGKTSANQGGLLYYDSEHRSTNPLSEGWIVMWADGTYSEAAAPSSWENSHSWHIHPNFSVLTQGVCAGCDRCCPPFDYLCIECRDG